MSYTQSSKDSIIRIWSRATLEPHITLTGHDGPVNAVGLQDGKVVSASGDNKMIMWDIESGNKLRVFEGHDRGLACIDFKVRSTQLPNHTLEMLNTFFLTTKTGRSHNLRFKRSQNQNLVRLFRSMSSNSPRT
jgi:WD40 repeat protein